MQMAMKESAMLSKTAMKRAGQISRKVKHDVYLNFRLWKRKSGQHRTDTETRKQCEHPDPSTTSQLDSRSS